MTQFCDSIYFSLNLLYSLSISACWTGILSFVVVVHSYNPLVPSLLDFPRQSFHLFFLSLWFHPDFSEMYDPLEKSRGTCTESHLPPLDQNSLWCYFVPTAPLSRLKHLSTPWHVLFSHSLHPFQDPEPHLPCTNFFRSIFLPLAPKKKKVLHVSFLSFHSLTPRKGSLHS